VGEKLYLGLMSGTSIDSIDAILLNCSTTKQAVIAYHEQPWPAELRQELQAITTPGSNEIDRMGPLDARVADLFANAALGLLQHAEIKPQQVTAIGCHGQTIRHRPNSEPPFTLQIGDPNRIAETTGITTVADFRRRDMAAGGQGAPLVPAYHEWLFRKGGENRVILNIGGISNLTVLPSDPTDPVLGFDSGPGNILLDGWAQTQLAQPYDSSGSWAASGEVNSKLLTLLLSDPYFSLPYPKSTGREYFNQPWLEERLDQNIKPEDVQATLTALTATSIHQAIGMTSAEVQRVIVCGGGVHNNELMRQLQELLGLVPLETTATYGIEPNQVEAAAFAWLAKQTMERRNGNLPTVTGASHAAVLGGIYPA
jgi:anhydro-N-acetylmuramic acid kinase